jgi:hypothetical protein
MLASKHFEQPGPAEAARVLGITQEADAKRDSRAPKRLEDAPATMPVGLESP